MADLLDVVRDFFYGIRREPERPQDGVRDYCPLEALPTEWHERDINRWLKEEFFSRSGRTSHEGLMRFIRYVSVEFEESNRVRMVIMTRAFVRLFVETRLSDAWHDHLTSSISFRVTSMTMLGVPLLPQFLSRWFTYLVMSIIGFIFNPILVRDGAWLRISSESIRLELHNYLLASKHSSVNKYLRDQDGNPQYSFVIFGAQTHLGGLKPQVYTLSAAGKKRSRPVADQKTGEKKQIAFRLADAWQLSLVAVISFCTVIMLRRNVTIGVPDFSQVWSLWSSLLLLVVSLGIINIARWVYQFYWGSKRRSIEFRAEEMRYRIDRIKRDVELDMHRFRHEMPEEEFEKDLLLAGRHRRKALILEETLEVFNRELKIKYVLAYLLTILGEYVAFKFFW